MPCLCPELLRRHSQSSRMPLDQQGRESFVIELDHLRAPEDQHGKRAGEREIKGVEEGFGPALHGPERGRTPILLADEIGDLSLAVDQMARPRTGAVTVGLGKWSHRVVQVSLNKVLS